MDVVSVGIGAAAAAAGSVGLSRWKEYRPTPRGVADLLNWAFLIDDGVVLQKDGSLVAGWSYRGPDVTAATAEELHHLARHVNDALMSLTDTWMFHVDAIRRPATPYPASAFPSPITALIDDERRATYDQQGHHFETEYFITVTHLPPADAFSRLGGWFVQGQDTGGVDWSGVLATFTGALRTLERRLAAVLVVERLDSQALLTYLHRCLTGLDHPIRVPPHGAYLNFLLSDQELVGGFEPQIGGLSIRTIAVHGFPQASSIGQLDGLSSLPMRYRWSTRVLPVGQHTAAKLIKRHQLNWFKKRKGAGAWLREMTTSRAYHQAHATQMDDDAFLDHDAQRMVRDASDAVAANTSGTTRFCFTTQVLVVLERDAQRADAVAADLVKVVQDAGFSARVETVNALDAFLGTLPGHGTPNVRRPLLSTANVADLLPVTSVWPGLSTNPSPYFPAQSPPVVWAQTDGSTPFRINLHDTDVGHTLLVGRTGAGKSTLVGLLTAQFQRYAKAQVFVFDVGYSAWALAHAARGQHYDLAAGAVDTLAFQPLADVDDAAERAWAAEWLEMLCTVQGLTITPPRRARIHAALQLLAQNDREHRTLTELTVHLQQAELVMALKPYMVGGVYGRLLDASDDALRAAPTPHATRYQVFELKHLMEMDDKILVPTAVYLFHRMEQQLDGSPTLVVFEELWAALMRTVFAEKIKQWLLTLRKQNAAVLLVAHSVGQLAQVAHRHVLLESCPTRIFLPNPDATARETAALYRDLGLNTREVEIIARAVPKQQYYFASPRGRRLFELGLGPVALSLFATPPGMTPETMRDNIRSLIDRYGDDWPAHWLRRQNVSTWADRFTARTQGQDTAVTTATTHTTSYANP
jgi:type IV secretion system protein VirB4